MSDNSCCSAETTRTAALFVGGIGSLCVIGVLAFYLVNSAQPAAVGTARAEERKKLWTELSSQNQDVLKNYAVLKPENGVYRLPVNRALEVMAPEWKDGNAAGRAKLLQRLEAATKPVTCE